MNDTLTYPLSAAAAAFLREQLALGGGYEPLTVGQLPLRDRPANRLVYVGPAALSTTEALALVIRGPYQLQQAVTLLSGAEGLGNLSRYTVSQVQQFARVGPATAASVVAALELARRLMADKDDDRLQIRSPADVASMMMAEISHLEQEEFWVVLLDTRNRVLGKTRLYRGSLNQSQVRVGEVFREAVRRNCAAVIVAHNHPSGDPAPSPEDIAVTRDLVAAGKLLSIEVLDHLVIGHGRWVSLRERGQGFEDATPLRERGQGFEASGG